MSCFRAISDTDNPASTFFSTAMIYDPVNLDFFMSSSFRPGESSTSCVWGGGAYESTVW